MQRGLHILHMMSFSGKGLAAAMTSKAYMKEQRHTQFVLHIQITPPPPLPPLRDYFGEVVN